MANKHIRIIRYLLSGIAAVILEYTLFLLIHYGLHLTAGRASALSFALALGASYGLQRFWTFSNQTDNSHLKAGVLYGILAFVNAGMSGFGVTILVDHDVPAYIAKACLMALIASYNFILYQKVIFKASNKEAAS